MRERKMNDIEKEIRRLSDSKYEEDKNYSIKENEAPCVVCGSKEFVQKFRNVVGEISGSFYGSYSLFGGSMSGSIDGYTKTLPVLSCRNCENEREIVTYKYPSGREIFWDFMHKFYFNKKDIDQFFLTRPIETRNYMIDNPNYGYSFYNELPYWDTETWAKAGFKIPKIKKKFLFFTWERYPTWKELSS